MNGMLITIEEYVQAAKKLDELFETNQITKEEYEMRYAWLDGDTIIHNKKSDETIS